MNGALSAPEWAAYQRDGFLIRKQVLTAVEVETLRLAADRVAARARTASRAGREYHLDGKRFVDVDHVTVQFEHAPGSDTVRVIEPAVHFDGELERLVDDPRIVEPMQQLVGCERLALWTDKLNLKRPREGSGFGWHQDSPYWVHDCAHVDQLPNVLVTFDDADEDNGCLRVVRGSHLDGCLPGTDDGSQLGGFYTHPDFVRPADVVAMTAPAGSLVFFSPHLIHGSEPNHSARARRALVLTYQPAGYPALKSGIVRNIAGSQTQAPLQ